ncbi:dihydrofolate reductase family protein [Actinophytocola gossypii]|uniref:Dihydrofolate reductase n=1 Tax=Actinophytocola gossypii TaxID=2812003 RepID=A0ABT2JG31_9PSEU|nr:dihydrofolate reductase family protein [Actinophytocola gossypii]MCT2586823.1 dihydrofolate reductase [Actinophytocola gossypii]
MRKVVLMMSVSLDGFVARTNGELDWLFPNMSADVVDWSSETLSEADTHVLGKENYLEQAAHWPTATDDLAPLINRATKVVFSSTLTTADWANSRIATGDLAKEIDALKQEPGGMIFVPGGARFAQSMSRAGLIDEYRLLVHPVALGAGQPLFAEEIALELIGTRSFETGVTALTYRRA